MPHVTARGVVREWHDDGGWGVIDSPETPGGRWVSFAHIDMAAPRNLRAGQSVDFTFESVTSQDGYTWVAVVVHPEGVAPAPPREPTEWGPDAFSSTLRIEYDDAPGPQSPPKSP
jgi:cold shock protein